MTRLQNGQSFPTLDVPAVGGGTISIPQSLRGSYGVVLIYRGAWCPYCQAQLAGFQRASEKLAEAGIKVVALSVDNEAATVGTIEKFKLSFPVGHSADADKVASITGAYTNASPHYLQATGFLLAPDGKILNAVYSSGPMGRLVAEESSEWSPISNPGFKSPQAAAGLSEFEAGSGKSVEDRLGERIKL